MKQMKPSNIKRIQAIQSLIERPGSDAEGEAARLALKRVQGAASRMTANQITAALLVAIPRRWPDSICWRNNTGSGIGMGAIKAAKALLRRGDIQGALNCLTRPVSFGLVGSSDIICVMGSAGRFVGIEVKVDDEQSNEQVAFEHRIKALGGIYLIAREVDECLEALAHALAVALAVKSTCIGQ